MQPFTMEGPCQHVKTSERLRVSFKGWCQPKDLGREPYWWLGLTSLLDWSKVQNTGNLSRPLAVSKHRLSPNPTTWFLPFPPSKLQHGESYLATYETSKVASVFPHGGSSPNLPLQKINYMKYHHICCSTFFKQNSIQRKWRFPMHGVPPVIIQFSGIKPSSYWGHPS